MWLLSTHRNLPPNCNFLHRNGWVLCVDAIISWTALKLLASEAIFSPKCSKREGREGKGRCAPIQVFTSGRLWRSESTTLQFTKTSVTMKIRYVLVNITILGADTIQHDTICGRRWWHRMLPLIGTALYRWIGRFVEVRIGRDGPWTVGSPTRRHVDVIHEWADVSTQNCCRDDGASNTRCTPTRKLHTIPVRHRFYKYVVKQELRTRWRWLRDVKWHKRQHKIR